MNKLFGTDGVRGTVGIFPLTYQLVTKLGRAVGYLLEEDRSTLTKTRRKRPFKVIIGKDTRFSCDLFEKALADGLSSFDVEVIRAGVVPTPALAYLTREFRADIGAMISASHNLASDNGIKLFASSGYKLSPTEEARIEELTEDSRLDGRPPRQFQLPEVVEAEARCRYIRFVEAQFFNLDLREIKVVCDCGNGAVYGLAQTLFKDMGAEVISMNDQPDGTNINLECGALHPQAMAKVVVDRKADIGFSLDGDGDRLIMSDEEGNVLDGDYIMAIVGLELMKQKRLVKDTLVVTVMSNFGLDVAIKAAGGKVVRTKVGDKYVLDEMLRGGYSVGGEQAGHVIFLERSIAGDGLITSLEVLKVMCQTKKRVSELSRCMSKFPQVLVNVKVKEKPPLSSIPRFDETVSRCESRLGGVGRVLVRYSGTEPVARVMVEGEVREEIEEMAHSIAGIIEGANG